MNASEILDLFTSLGTPIRLAADGTLRVPSRGAEARPDLVEALRQLRAEATTILGARPKTVYPCIRCGRESTPENLFCRVECFECWKAERPAERRKASAAT